MLSRASRGALYACLAVTVSLAAFPAFSATLHGRNCYQLGENDTPAKAKEQARLGALRSLVSNYKTYVFSSTETKNLILQNDQLQAIAGGPLRKLECSFPPVANYNVCADCVAEVVDEEMNRFIEARLQDLGISSSGPTPKLVASKKTGSLSIQANTEGSLSIDGKAVDTIRPTDTIKVDNLAIGKQEIILNTEGRTLSKEVFISENEVTPVYFRDPVAALSKGDRGEILDQKTLVQALQYLGKNYGQVDRVNELLKERILGKRILVRGFVLAIGEPGKDYKTTPWLPPNRGEFLKPNTPLVMKVDEHLNDIEIRYAFAMSDREFSYDQIFSGSFCKDFPALCEKYLKGIGAAKPSIYVRSGKRGALSNINYDAADYAFGFSWNDRDSISGWDLRVPLIELIGTVKDLDAALVGYDPVQLRFMVLSDARIVSINNADPDTLRAEIFEQDKAKEKGLDEILSGPRKSN